MALERMLGEKDALITDLREAQAAKPTGSTGPRSTAVRTARLALLYVTYFCRIGKQHLWFLLFNLCIA